MPEARRYPTTTGRFASRPHPASSRPARRAWNASRDTGTSLLGGRFSLAGTVLGALIIQTLTYTTYSIGVPPEATLVVKAAVVLVVSVIQSATARAVLGKQMRRVFPSHRAKSLSEVA